MAVRSKVPVSPALRPMGPRVTFRHEGGTYIAGGISEHLRHITKRNTACVPAGYIHSPTRFWLFYSVQHRLLCCTALRCRWLSAYYATLRISHKESAIAPSSVFIQQPLCLRWGSGIIQSRAVKVSVQLLIMVILI